MTAEEMDLGLALLKDNDLHLLSFLHRHRFMTRYQIQRMFFEAPRQCKRRLEYLDKIRAVNRLQVNSKVNFPPVYMMDIAGARFLGLRSWTPDVMDVNSICKYLQLVNIYYLLSPGITKYRVRPTFDTYSGFYSPMAVFDYVGIGNRERTLILDIFRPGDNDDLARKLRYLSAFLDEAPRHFESMPAVVLNCCDDEQIRSASYHLNEHIRKVVFTTDERLINMDLNFAFVTWDRETVPIPNQDFFLPSSRIV